jgi:tetratricopeptide (TPR) repeat protein
MDPHLQRAQLLIQQSRYEQALKELQQALVADPDNALAHAFMSVCLTEQNKLDDALAAARRAAHLEPDFSYAHFVLGNVLAQQDKLKEAEAAAQEAIRLAAWDADNFALLARIKFRQKQWQATLDAAEQGLEVEAEHAGCQNLRALALARLGRSEEATRALDEALAQDPENAVTHANRGWTQLQNGQRKEALASFREALRLEPTLEWARAGMIEALKARYLIYRLMLQYFFWMERLDSRAQWFIIIGLYVASRVSRSLSQSTPALAPVLVPVNYLYLVFVFLSWTARPLFNLLLRLSPFGRMLLDRRQIVGSNVLGACLLGALLAAGVALVLPSADWLQVALVLVVMALPLGAYFNGDEAPPKAIQIGTYALVGLGLLTILLISLNAPLAGALMLLYFLGILGFGILANVVSQRQ